MAAAWPPSANSASTIGRTMLSSFRYCPVMSTGLRVPAKGTISFSRRCAASGRAGTSSPSSAAASAIITPKPPEVEASPRLARAGNLPAEQP